MFSLFNGIYDSYLAPTQMNLLVVGAPSVGKTTLLERLKVTEMPNRVKNGEGSKGVSTRLGAEALSMTLHRAFVETGAQEVPHLSRSSSIVVQSKAEGVTKTSKGVGLDKKSATSPQTSSNGTPSTKDPRGNYLPSSAIKSTQKKRFTFCPAPERYRKSKDSDDSEDQEVFVLETDESEEEKQRLIGSSSHRTTQQQQQAQDGIREAELSSSGVPAASNRPQRMRSHSKEFDVDRLDLMDGRQSSLQDIPLDRGESSSSLPLPQQQQQQQTPQTRNIRSSDSSTNSTKSISQHFIQVMAPGEPLRQESPEEYDLKPSAKMLPLKLIRPTIGTNLGKLDMYGAKCHVFDVGGRLQDLWERYYDDCDAVIFCWKMGEDPDKATNDDHNGEDDDDCPMEIYKQQQEILNRVRKSIPDDVPFLIFGHIFGHANVSVVDRMYSTDLLLPHYHNPMTGLCCGSAKTGAGVQSAMGWLIPLAKRQQKERLASRRQMEEKEV